MGHAGCGDDRVRKIIRSDETALSYERQIQPRPKLGRWKADIDRMVAKNADAPTRERLTLIRLFEELRELGYEGGYDAVRRYAKSWSREHASQAATAYVPLSFAPGEAYQFDWSQPGVRRLAQDRLQDLRAVQRPRPRGLVGPLAPADPLRQPAAGADRKPHHPLQAGEAPLGRPQNPRAFGAPARRRFSPSRQEHDPCGSVPAWSRQTAESRLAGAPPARRSRKGLRPTIFGAPTSRANSSSATGAIAIPSPSPTTPPATF